MGGGGGGGFSYMVCQVIIQVIMEDIQLHGEFLLGMIFAAFPFSRMQWGVFQQIDWVLIFFSFIYFSCLQSPKIVGRGGGGFPPLYQSLFEYTHLLCY